MRQAFTLVETLLSLALVSVLIGMGISISFKATQREQVNQAGSKLQAAYEQARTFVLAGKKVGCVATKLAGWGVMANANNYELFEYCTTLPSAGILYQTVPYSSSGQVTLFAFPAPNPIIFKPLGQGIFSPAGSPFTTMTSAVLSGSGFQKQVNIYPQGQINSVALALAPTPTLVPATPTPTATPAPPTPTPSPTPTLTAGNGAQFISQSVPSTMVKGTVNSVSITMKNLGTTTWTTGTNYRLGSQQYAANDTTWTTTRAYLLPNPTSVAPYGQYTFTFDVTAPATAGNYNFQWKMVQEGVAWFGPLTTNIVVTVTDTSATNTPAPPTATPAPPTVTPTPTLVPPVGYWNFNQVADNTCTGGVNDACNSGTGGSAIDGAKTGMTTSWPTGKYGNGLDFDGVNDNVRMLNNASINFGTGNFTLAAWVKNNGNDDDMVFFKRAGADNLGYTIYIGALGRVRFQLGDGTNVVTTTPGTSDISDNTYHHVAMTVSRTTNIGRIYIDGIQDGSDINIATVTGSSTTTSNLWIGAADNSTSFSGGQIDEVRIYNYALTAAQVVTVRDATN